MNDNVNYAVKQNLIASKNEHKSVFINCIYLIKDSFEIRVQFVNTKQSK